jgi:hypothetical protein
MKRCLILALGLLGCSEDVESTDIRTSGIYPEFTVTATGNGRSQVEARLKVGGSDSNTFLDLTGPDTLEVTVDGDTKTLDGTDNHRYVASFDVDAGGTEFSFAFLRGEADDSAPVSVVELPEPFAMQVTTSEVERTVDDVAFTWDPPGDGDIGVHVDGACLFFESAETPDDGSGSVTAEDLEPPGEDDGEECTGTVQLTRTERGTLDPAFSEGGAIRAHQVRSDTFKSVPPAE